MSVAITVLLLWAFMSVSRDTPTGQLLRRWMVDLPAKALNRLRRWHLMLAVGLVGLGCLLIWYGGNDGLRVASMTLPDMFSWFTTIEVSTYVDVLTALVAASLLTKVRCTWVVIETSLLRFWRRARGSASGSKEGVDQVAGALTGHASCAERPRSPG
ncbi:hypothetical protein C0V97_02935 [Asaia sp. W19]|nr:hypothetical protein C0V97_02935 [Asaia sp. W19]